MKLIFVMVLGVFTASSFAHEIESKDRKNLAWLAQMTRSHAMKICSGQPAYVSCRNEQIRALAETAATIPGLIASNIPPREFVVLVEMQAITSSQESRQTSPVLGSSGVDCRIDVC